jgi:hypothetical protein
MPVICQSTTTYWLYYTKRNQVLIRSVGNGRQATAKQAYCILLIITIVQNVF